MIDVQTGMVQVLQAVLDAEGQGPGDLTPRVYGTFADTPPGEVTELILMLKSSRCLDVTEGERTETGARTVASINSITTRGLRELQRAQQAPAQVHSCPTDGDDGRLGFDGN